MKEVLPWLVWACRADTNVFCLALVTLVSPIQNIIFPHCTLFHFLSPHHSATWAGSRAGSPVFVSHTVAQGVWYRGKLICSLLFNIVAKYNFLFMDLFFY